MTAVALVSALGASFLKMLGRLGDVVSLIIESVSALVTGLLTLRLRPRETFEQMFVVGVQSLGVILFSLAFTAIMLLGEFSFHMKLVLRQDSLVPAFSTVLMVRELGPVLTCLLLSSRVGAGIAAELGTMKITEQLDALRLLSLDPVEYLLIPRWIACVFGCTCLVVVALAVALIGGAFLSSLTLGFPVAQYFHTMFLFTRVSDFVTCLIKAAVFGTIIPLAASYHGFHCRAGSAGVGDAATSAVVHSSILIIIADFVVTYLQYAL